MKKFIHVTLLGLLFVLLGESVVVGMKKHHHKEKHNHSSDKKKHHEKDNETNKPSGESEETPTGLNSTSPLGDIPIEGGYQFDEIKCSKLGNTLQKCDTKCVNKKKCRVNTLIKRCTCEGVQILIEDTSYYNTLTGGKTSEIGVDAIDNICDNCTSFCKSKNKKGESFTQGTKWKKIIHSCDDGMEIPTKKRLKYKSDYVKSAKNVKIKRSPTDEEESQSYEENASQDHSSKKRRKSKKSESIEDKEFDDYEKTSGEEPDQDSNSMEKDEKENKRTGTEQESTAESESYEDDDNSSKSSESKGNADTKSRKYPDEADMASNEESEGKEKLSKKSKHIRSEHDKSDSREGESSDNSSKKKKGKILRTHHSNGSSNNGEENLDGSSDGKDAPGDDGLNEETEGSSDDKSERVNTSSQEINEGSGNDEDESSVEEPNIEEDKLKSAASGDESDKEYSNDSENVNGSNGSEGKHGEDSKAKNDQVDGESLQDDTKKALRQECDSGLHTSGLRTAETDTKEKKKADLIMVKKKNSALEKDLKRKFKWAPPDLSGTRACSPKGNETRTCIDNCSLDGLTCTTSISLQRCTCSGKYVNLVEVKKYDISYRKVISYLRPLGKTFGDGYIRECGTCFKFCNQWPGEKREDTVKTKALSCYDPYKQ